MTEDVWERLGGIARFAPTPHNTQPFRIRPRDARTAELVLVPERLLPAEDHGNLYEMAAFGIFMASLERAGRHFGIKVEVEPIVSLDAGALTRQSSPLVLGTARITGDVAAEPQDELREARRTSRLPYEERSVPKDVQGELARIVEAAGHRLVLVDDPATVLSLLRLNTNAIIDNLQLREERLEIRDWHRLGKTPEFGDGLWQEPMCQPAWELWSAFAVPWLFRIPGFRGFARWRYHRTQRGTRHVALLSGKFREWPELLAAGRMLLELWLAMARHGVHMHPYGSMLTNPHYAALIAGRFKVDDSWLVFRYGYSAVPPRSPRLRSIVIHE